MTLPADSAEKPIADDNAPHILVIDDDSRIRNLLSRYLGEHGFRVTAAANAEDARRRLAGLAFDLLIVDVMMPCESGLDLRVGRLRRHFSRCRPDDCGHASALCRGNCKMNIVVEVAKELLGMFLADARLTMLILVLVVLVALVAGLMFVLHVEPVVGGCVLVFGCLGILIEATVREARRRRLP